MSRKDRKLAKKAAKAAKALKPKKKSKVGRAVKGTTIVVVLTGAALRKLGLLDGDKVKATKTKATTAAKKAATTAKKAAGAVQDKLPSHNDEPKARP